MNEYRCGTCGWAATSPTVDGMLAAAKHHQKTGCRPTPAPVDRSK